MPEPLKNMYNQDSVGALAIDIHSVDDSFNVDEFLEATMDKTWDNLELKGRVRKISTNLGKYLPKDYKSAIRIIDKIVMNHEGFFGTIFPDFVEVHGQNESHWDLSISALENYTQYSTSEFAVRPFIVNHEEKMMAKMYEWSKHENEHVRRLASEGCRPQLPWGQALVKYKKDPSPILPILTQLKSDPSLYVRKSVANNLNDISKTHPELVTELAENWYGESEYTDWIVKHGCRTLLKKGNPEVLSIFGYFDGDKIIVRDFALGDREVPIGEKMNFSFSVSSNETAKIRLEYGIDYMKSNGKTNRKIFQISETTLAAGEKRVFNKNHSFAVMSTRVLYPGKHAVCLIVNGIERETLDFEVVVK